MADIINMAWTMPETRPDGPRGIARLAARRDALPDSRRGRPDQRGRRQNTQEEQEPGAEFGQLLEEPFPEYEGLVNSLARAAELDFVASASGGNSVLEMRDRETQAVLLQIPLNNPHELATNGGVLVKGQC